MKAEGGRQKPEGRRQKAEGKRNRARSGRSSSSFLLHPSALREARVLVVGDAMLDRYWFGEVGRISPEAPVPIVKIEKEEERPGGAANVARNAAALGAQVSLLSVVGADEAGTRLGRLLKRERINAQLHRDRSIKTTVKLRVIGRRQQLLRVDFETPPSHEVLASKLRNFGELLRDADVVILSDYGKGGLTHIARMIGMARRAGKPVLVDPKGEDYSRYRGATVITPNRIEFRQVAGPWKNERELAERAQRLRRKLDAEALLITRSEEGMTLFQDGSRFHVAAQAREVFDVSGAGDTVIAALGVALASGARMSAAVRLANRAAGIVVGKFGTAVVTPEELVGKAEGRRQKAEG
ncbi:MAG: D-glycero-beta-D-manno-heptose-7-phosphate kinase [Betaproteobacteria bacterium]|nr:D-glycero-beta-D-manno-heptose-7-phosphate kinase [Betaproteobacteria bacterium]